MPVGSPLYKNTVELLETLDPKRTCNSIVFKLINGEEIVWDTEVYCDFATEGCLKFTLENKTKTRYVPLSSIVYFGEI